MGVSVTPFFSIYHNNFEKDISLINELVKTLRCYLKNNKQAEIHLFVFHGGSRDSDVGLLNYYKRD